MKTKSIFNYRYTGLVAALIVLLIAAAFIAPAMFTLNSISSMLSNNAVYGILAVGVMFVLLTGCIDISVGSVLAVSSVVATKVMTAYPSTPSVVYIAIGIAVGALCGTINGFFAGKLKIAPLIVTLATMNIFRGAAFVISGGAWIFPHKFTKSFNNLSQLHFLGFNTIAWWNILIFVAAAIFLYGFKHGRRLYAVGTSESSSEISGINTGNVKLLAYILCGICAGLAGVLYSSNYAISNSDIGAGYEMTAIAICILGGVSINGGVGRMDGVVIAFVIMSIITNLLSMISGFSVWQNALQGTVIIIAVIITITGEYLRSKRELRERGLRI